MKSGTSGTLEQLSEITDKQSIAKIFTMDTQGESIIFAFLRFSG